MRAVAICGSIALAVVLTLAALPASRWVLLNQVDVLASPNKDADIGQGDIFQTPMIPKWLTDPNTYTGPDRAEQIAHAVYLPQKVQTPALQQFGRDHADDPMGWVLIIRQTCKYVAPGPDAPKNGVAITSRRVGIAACKEGQRIEPNNAYFPLERAAFEMELGSIDAMDAALKSAAGKTDYDDHVKDEAMALDRAAALAKGYRGELVRMAASGSIQLPDFIDIKLLGRQLNRKGSLAEKRDLIQTLHTMSLREDTGIGILVAFSDIRYALRPPIPAKTSNGPKLTDDEWVRLAHAFDTDLSDKRIPACKPDASEIYGTLKRLRAAFTGYVNGQSSIYYQPGQDESRTRLLFVRTAAPFGTLSALFFGGVFSLLAWALARVQSGTFRSIVPHLVWIPAWGVGTAFPQLCCTEWSLSGLVYGLSLLMYACMLFDRRIAVPVIVLLCAGVWEIVLGNSPGTFGVWMALCVLSVGMVLFAWFLSPQARHAFPSSYGPWVALLPIVSRDWPASAGAVGFFIALGLLWKNRTGESPKVCSWLTGVLFVLMMIGAAFEFTWVAAIQAVPSTGLMVAGVMGLLAAVLFTCKSVRLVRITACVSVVLFTALYLGATGWEVWGNNSERLVQAHLLNEGNIIRRLAGVSSP